MLRRILHRPLAGLLVLGPILWQASAAATTLVPVNDGQLERQTPVILVGQVAGTLPVLVEYPVTDWLVTVERVVKGSVPGGSVVVRVPGGEGADGMTLTLFGAPTFKPGERVLLFLRRHADSTYRVQQFSLGAFHGVRRGQRTAAVRDLSETQVVGRRRHAPSRGRVRDLDGFADWLEDRARGRRPRRDYFFRPTRREKEAITARFTLFESRGLNLRWFEFDSGGSVPWRAHQGGQPGLSGGGFTELQRGLGAWNAEPSTPIDLRYAGTTANSTGFTSFDGQNVLLFDDPNGEIEGTFDCAEGGTLAIGGPWSNSNDIGSFNNKNWVRIAGADIVMNDGIECAIQRSPNGSKLMEEVYGHELGHTLGLGHSSENENETNATLRQALMFFQAHDDARGARLQSDDIAGIRTLYRRSTGGGGGGTGSCPADTLCLLNGRFKVTATWENQFNGTSGSAGTVVASDIAGYLHFGDPRNIELIVKVVDFGTSIRFFWGQLTNLRYTIRVEDTQGGSVQTYRNTPGDCGGFEELPLTGGPEASHGASGGGGSSSLGTCREDADTMCLLGARFAVEMTWRNQFNNTTGVGIPNRLTEFTGAFAFTDPRNLEILVKTLQFPDRVLVIYGALSNLEYTLRVTDTTTGTVKTYFNPAGTYCGGLDNNAFPP
ncbi:MAG TPA: matrixin family metalloprotease [Thermoanaerobaculia bacterium]|nr:matrixin family metalloprotease [Thermoanaerobaculia bacterium]